MTLHHPTSSSRQVFMLAAILSLLIHASLLAALNQWSRWEPTTEKPPLVTVTLVPTPSLQPEPMETPALPVKPATASPPALPHPSRPSAAVLPPVPPTGTALAPPLEPPPRKPPVMPQPKTRTLTDRRTADALLAQRLLKRAKPSSTPISSVQATNPAPLPTAVPPMLPSIATADLSREPVHTSKTSPKHAVPFSQPTRRVLLAKGVSAPPGPSRGKVGIVHSVPPTYPRIAREEGWEGTVILRVTVSPSGRAEDIRVRKSSGYPALDQAAINAVKTWVFRPAHEGNIPIRTRVDIPVRFDLRQATG